MDGDLSNDEDACPENPLSRKESHSFAVCTTEMSNLYQSDGDTTPKNLSSQDASPSFTLCRTEVTGLESPVGLPSPDLPITDDWEPISRKEMNSDMVPTQSLGTSNETSSESCSVQ